MACLLTDDASFVRAETITAYMLIEYQFLPLQVVRY